MGMSISITGGTVNIGDSSPTSTGNNSDSTVLNDLGPLMPGFGSATGSCATGSSAAGGSPPNITASYNKLMSDLSANGTSKGTIEDDANGLKSTLQEDGLGNSNLMTATENMTNSLDDGTFSQQGSQGALEGAAQQDGLQNVIAPQIDGNAGMQSQNAGDFDGNSTAHGSLGANVNILDSEMAGGAPQSQVLDNATALAKEATNAGDTGVAGAAQNIINSLGDGTYNAQASETALNNALSSAPNAG